MLSRSTNDSLALSPPRAEHPSRLAFSAPELHERSWGNARVIGLVCARGASFFRAQGRLQGEDLEIFAVWLEALAEETRPHLLYLDLAQVEHLAEGDLIALGERLQRAVSRLRGLVSRAAIVRPRWVLGAALEGVVHVFGLAPAVRTFIASAETNAVACAWLRLPLPLVPAGEAAMFWHAFERPKLSTVERLREYLASNLDESSLDSAAHVLGLSRRSLQRALHDSNTNFRAVLAHVRVAHAKVLLETTSMTVLAISMRVGLKKPQHLREAFTLCTGKSPRQWRSQASGGSESAPPEVLQGSRTVTESGVFPLRAQVPTGGDHQR
jgi:AraC-like DNA-binding protein